MFGLNHSQTAYLILGTTSTIVAWYLATRGRIYQHKLVAIYLTTVMAADIIGILLQFYVVKDVGYASAQDVGLVRLARQFDTATYLGWPIALAALGALVFGGNRVGRRVGWAMLGVWALLLAIVLGAYPNVGAPEFTTDAYRAREDIVFTLGHVIGVLVGFVVAIRYYLQKRWPLLPQIATSILLLGALSDCAGQYAQAKPSADYDLSSVTGVVVHLFITFAHGYAMLRLRGTQ